MNWRFCQFVNLSNDGRKVWATVLFLGAFMHSKVIHVNFFNFFLPYLQDHGLLRSRNFASMTVWRDDAWRRLVSGADLGGWGAGGVHPPPEMTCGFLIQLVFCHKKTMWFISVEVEQETSAPLPKKNPGSAPASLYLKRNGRVYEQVKGGFSLLLN